MACVRDLAAFRDAMYDASQRYRHINIVKYWNTCCDRCLASSPVLCVKSDMTLADVMRAHGMSLQGTINILRSLQNNDNDITDTIERLKHSVAYATSDTPTHVIEFTKSLSQLYNTTCTLDNGAVIQTVTTDSTPFRVGLQGLVFVRDSDLRKQNE